MILLSMSPRGMISSCLRTLALVAMVGLGSLGGLRQAAAAAIAPDAGWVDGAILSVNDVVAFNFTTTGASYFSLTDCCLPGDIWTIFGDISGTSTLGLSPVAVPLGIGQFFADFDTSWLDAGLTHFQTLLSAGTYAFSITGNGVGGLPADFGVRVDTAAVPVPAGSLMLLAALAGLGVLTRRRKSSALA